MMMIMMAKTSTARIYTSAERECSLHFENKTKTNEEKSRRAQSHEQISLSDSLRTGRSSDFA